MSNRTLAYAAILSALVWSPTARAAQTQSQPSASRQEPPSHLPIAMLPTDRTLRVDGGIPPEQTGSPWEIPPEQEHEVDYRLPRELLHPVRKPPMDLKSLLRPRLEFQAEWEPEAGGLAISTYDFSMQMPIYPILGPPPPLITAGYSLTNIEAPPALDLPETLHDFSLGLAWMRRINDKWMARFMLNGAFASDLENTSSDAWQVRLGGFAIYRPNERWSWALGAMATGRDDIPVIPAVGVIWEPSPQVRVDLMLPNPRVSKLLVESGKRQHWGYVSGGFSGGTWAYDRTGPVGDRLTYRAWRLVLGWETMPPRPPETFRPTGTRFGAEVGYVFGRKLEFDGSFPDISMRNTLLFRTGIRF